MNTAVSAEEKAALLDAYLGSLPPVRYKATSAANFEPFNPKPKCSDPSFDCTELDIGDGSNHFVWFEFETHRDGPEIEGVGIAGMWVAGQWMPVWLLSAANVGVWECQIRGIVERGEA